MFSRTHRRLAVALALCLPVAATPAIAGQKCRSARAQSVALKTAAKSDIVDTAVAAGSFKTLAAALQAAGLVETLKEKDNSTKPSNT